MSLVHLLLIGILLVTRLNLCYSESVTVKQESVDKIIITWIHLTETLGFELRVNIGAYVESDFLLDKTDFSYEYKPTKYNTLYTFEVKYIDPEQVHSIGKVEFKSWPGKPKPPEIDIRLTKVDKKTIQVFWINVNSDVDVELYEAIAKENDNVVDSCKSTRPTDTSCKIEAKLNYDKMYYVSVRVKLADIITNGYIGEYSDYSDQYKYTTTPETIPSAPSDLQLSLPALGQIEVKWNASTIFPDSSKYEAKCTKKVNMHNYQKSTTVNEQPSTSKICPNLEHDTEYIVTVVACIKTFCSEILDGTIKTAIGPPGPPSISKVVDIGNREVYIWWKNPEKLNGPLDEVTVTARIGDDEKGNCTWTKSKELSCSIKNLDFFTEYSFTAVGYNKPQEAYDFSGGHGESSKAILFKTSPGLPDVPEAVSPTVNGAVIAVTWKAPKVINGDIELYQAQAEIGEEVIEKCETKPEELSCSFDQNLKYGTVYNVSVRAKTKPNNQNQGGGYGSYSTPVEVTTDESASVNVGLIVGLVVGAIVLIALIALIIVLVKRRNITPDDDSTSKDSGDDIVQL